MRLSCVTNGLVNDLVVFVITSVKVIIISWDDWSRGVGEILLCKLTGTGLGELFLFFPVLFLLGVTVSNEPPPCKAHFIKFLASGFMDGCPSRLQPSLFTRSWDRHWVGLVCRILTFKDWHRCRKSWKRWGWYLRLSSPFFFFSPWLKGNDKTAHWLTALETNYNNNHIVNLNYTVGT